MDHLQAMSEGVEEALSLLEVLSSRNSCITELEVWALCRECALTLEYMQSEPDLYQGLCITPETVAFDQTGSVCFLDLGIEPDAFYVPPEYQHDGHTYKSQLFSLGMTMLYAVEHQDEHKPELSQKLTNLLSRLTADDQNQRPELDTVISHCEEELDGQSSQDICLILSTVTPSPSSQEANGSSILDLTSGLTEYLQSQSTFVSQSPLPFSPPTESVNAPRQNMDHQYRHMQRTDQHSSGKHHQGETPYLDNNQNVTSVSSKHFVSDIQGNSPSHEHSRRTYIEYSSSVDRDGYYPEDHGTSNRASSGHGPSVQESSVDGVTGHGVRTSGSFHTNLHKHGPDPRMQQQLGPGSEPFTEQTEYIKNGQFSLIENHTSTPTSSSVEDNQPSPSPSKERRKQGMTIADVLDWINRYLNEQELWAICREGVLALQRKKKHLPAYISPDTLVVRGDGSVTFKAIPEDKPLEVIFMAPELQQKGVLSEKTCLYGLGITLRCVAGQKYSTSLSLQVSQNFEQLLLGLLQPSPESRPSLQTCLQMCDNHEAEGNPPSKLSCQELYNTALNTSKQPCQPPLPQQPRQTATPPPIPPPPPADDDDIVSEEELNLEYVVEEEQDLGYDHIQGHSSTDGNALDDEEEIFVDEPAEFEVPSPPPSFKSVKKTLTEPSIGGSAFKPVALKPGPSGNGGQRVPSAFSSPATHFKPIVLHDASADANVQEEAKTRDFDFKEKETEVMKKLRELKSDLSKPRKLVAKESGSSDGSRTDSSNSGKEPVQPSSLESLLKQLQGQGQMPNTQSLASAIAQHLKGQVGGEYETHASAEMISPPQVPHRMTSGPPLPPTMTSSVVQQKMLSPAHYQGMMGPGTSYPLAIPTQMDRAVTFPMQYGGYPGLPPFQMQLQQDPRTGMMSWVPIMPFSSQPALGSSLPINQSPDFYRNIPSQPLSGYSSDAQSTHNKSDLNDSMKDEELSSSPYRIRVPSSASSTKSGRDYVSPQRGTVSETSPDGYTSDANVLRRQQSEQFHDLSPVSSQGKQNVHNPPQHDFHGRLVKESRSSPHYKHFQSSMKPLSVPDHQPESPGATTPQRLSNQNVTNDDSNASQTSSPSPSKDSGVSGVQVATKAYPNTDASLLDRLLSPESLHRQQVQGRVLQLVREGQGFDMLFEQNSEDCAMAEYITSLANLKWETFASAITEKYSQLYWGDKLLCKLYDIINAHPVQPQTSASTRSPPPPLPTRYSSYKATDNARDHPETRTKEWGNQFHHNHLSEPGHTSNPQNRSGLQDSVFDQRERGFSERSNRRERLLPQKSEPLPNKPQIVTKSNFSPQNSEQVKIAILRSQSACQGVVGSSAISETSDSTDTEKREKKRRFKKRYELDRTKSSSMHNISSGAMLTVSDHRRSDSYVVDIPVDGGVLNQGEITPVNRGTPHYLDSQLEFQDDHFQDPQFRHRDYVVDRSSSHSPAYSEILPGVNMRHSNIGHRGSIQETFVDHSNRPPSRKASSLSATPVLNLDSSSRNPSVNFETYKYNSLPRDAFKRQTSMPSQRASYPAQQYDKSHQPVLDRQQEISQRVGRDHDRMNSSLSNISGGDMVSKSSYESDSETNFRNNVRRTSAKIMQQNNNDRRISQDSRNSYRGNGNVKDKVSQAKLNKSGQKSSSASSLHNPNRLSDSNSKSSGQQYLQVYVKKGQVVYHWAVIQLSMSSEVETFMQQIEQEEDNQDLLQERLSAIKQQLSVQRKERKTSQRFYKKLTEPAFKAEKGVDQKTSQVLKNLSEMTKKIRFLELCKTHLQMLLTELYGLDPSYLYSLLVSPDNKPLVLQPYTENPSLQFQPLREPHSGCEVQVLQAGDPKGLMAYLFTSSALSDGYIHQFLYTFRYFLAPEQLFDFIRTRYIAACRSNQSDGNIVRVMHRAVDLLHFWLEGFYSIDFEKNNALVQRLEAFVREHVNSADPDSGSSLRKLMQACQLGPTSELLGETIGETEDNEKSTCFVHLETSKKRSRAEMLEEWDSFRSGSKVKVTPKHRPSLPDLSMDLEKFRNARSMTDITAAPTTFTRRADAFSMMDFSPSNLAEQLTLMEQDLFMLTHPIHYLNSKAQGVGVSLSMPGLRTPSMQRKNRQPEVTSLFVSDTKFDSVIQRIISYNQEVAHWVAAEIVTCTSTKSQCVILNKFIQVAQLCAEIRNFSTCLAILDGLENLIVRQLPSWKSLPSKCGGIMEDLEKIKVQVKGEQNCLMKEKDSHLCPTIPSVLYFLLHVQQLEIGSFQLANGMHKWTKMRSISQMIDQIRVFRENEFLFEPDEAFQDTIHQRIVDFSDQDLHTVASNNDTNFRKITAGGLSGVFRKVKDKLQSKGEK
ncbi:kinase non-catalytic C-lobe domain-containing protein 1-like isoform X1 [Haliotis rufescens]|uniref:kinase non-catalytic C-lobe domain-containing protein 1-like isoform X1 n=2 Tax=Haliotis rufescens TaxID=6454 RepID=UPI00201EA900|nr:kinase non-catalytic C-lobe domain-containing protein 1-like isoform X1 [Haliotis rufescens]